jgi:hypothetical protein
VRITAPASVLRMHVEVYAAGGEKLFDQEIRGGNVFDWHLQDGQAQRLVPGSYVCVVTAKSVSGRITQRIGSVSIEEQSVSVQAAESPQLSAAQAQAIGPIEENSSWTIAGQEEPQTPTVIAHDGADGQMIRGRGALTFRIGNFFTGNDREQMRLTEDGRLGIGTNDPRATLDVAGTIRAQRFLVVKPKPAEPGKSAQEYLTNNATEPGELLITGSGTQNRIAKWLDNAGTLGDSAITETAGGFVGIGTTVPGSKLVVSGNSATLPAASGIARFADADGTQTAVFADAFGTNPIFNVRRANGTAASPSAVQANQLLGVIGASGYGASAYMGTRARVGFFASENWTNTANGTYLTLNTTANGAATAGGTERLRIDSAGNVGIGTTAPQQKVHVVGADSRLRLESTQADSYAVTEYNTNARIWHTGVGGSTVASGVNNKYYIYDGTAGQFRLVIDTSGRVGIGTTTSGSKLSVVGGSDDAVVGSSTTGAGVSGLSSGNDGVYGSSNSAMGVHGVSVSGVGVRATSSSGNLVEGYNGLTRRFHIDNGGTYVAGSDFAEALPANGDRTAYEPGDVLVVSSTTPGKVEKASRAYDPRVAGIYSTRPGILGADKNGTSRVDKDDVPVAIVGIVPTKVSALNGSIRVGDLLTTSNSPGYAMRCANRVKCVGAIVGKALEPLANGKGVIKVLVMLR